jgi:hypothetical protein
MRPTTFARLQQLHSSAAVQNQAELHSKQQLNALDAAGGVAGRAVQLSCWPVQQADHVSKTFAMRYALASPLLLFRGTSRPVCCCDCLKQACWHCAEMVFLHVPSNYTALLLIYARQLHVTHLIPYPMHQKVPMHQNSPMQFALAAPLLLFRGTSRSVYP